MKGLIWFLTKIVLPFLIFSPLILYYIVKPPNYEEIVLTDRTNINYIKILRDKYAVPHLSSDNLVSVFYGIGYAQAQDRLWEMSFKKIVFSGRLSEFMGKKTLDIDNMMRNFGFRRISISNYENMEPIEKQHLQAFADGVNDYVKRLPFLPLEFLITGIKFEEWTPVDSILILKLMEFSLTLKWSNQLLRHHLEEFYEREFIKEITGAGIENHYDKNTILNDEELIQSNIFENNTINNSNLNLKNENSNRTNQKNQKSENKNLNPENQYLAEGFQNIMDSLHESGRGSNSWVIHGNYTKTGKPILANDPHLDNAIPSIWYPAYISYGLNREHNVFGFCNAGSPFIVIGQNQRVSWGITALLGDDSDLYQEKLNDIQTHYEYDGHSIPLEILKEEIKIKGENDVHTEIIKITKHGIILNQPYDLLTPKIFNEKNENLAFSWTGNLKRNSFVKALLKTYTSNNIYDFKNATQMFDGVYLNLLFADVEGNIGYVGTGLHKIKNRNDNDYFPSDGTNSENDWLGFVPKNESIFVINPKKGYIVTANNKQSTDNIKYNYVRTGKPTSRSTRINNLIKSYISYNKKIGVEDVKKMQLDMVDEYAAIICPRLIKIVQNNLKMISNKEDQTHLKHMISLLEKWNYEMSANSKQALIYNVWYSHLSNRLLNQIDPLLFHRRIVTHYGYEQFLIKKLIDWAEKKINFDEFYCKVSNSNIKSNTSCLENVVYSLLETKKYVENILGEESRGLWEWKNIMFSKYPHKPFSQTPLKFLYEVTKPGKGNMNTINVAGLKPQVHGGFIGRHSSNMRFISSLDKNDKSYFVIDTGISESPFSIHYTDMMSLHYNGEYLEIKKNGLKDDVLYSAEIIANN